MHKLKRRGYDLGEAHSKSPITDNDEAINWRQGKPVLLPGICHPQLAQQSENIKQSLSLYQAILNRQECDSILAAKPYSDRLDRGFEPLGSSINEGDDQEIETILFDAVENGNVQAEDLWIKVSWLSFYEEDASLRFRFSFGVDHVEDVAADKLRQQHAALLTDAVFPESRLITQNSELNRRIREILGCTSISFVERIVYFNSPEGGAYLHHDRERGHAGVAYAQLSGTTYWLALPKQQLVREITDFINRCETTAQWPETIDPSCQHQLRILAANNEKLASELDSFSNNALIHLINETKSFVQQLISNGHGRLVESGDALLLPQETNVNCCWHSVFSLGEQSGEALSFAIRAE